MQATRRAFQFYPRSQKNPMMRCHHGLDPAPSSIPLGTGRPLGHGPGHPIRRRHGSHAGRLSQVPMLAGRRGLRPLHVPRLRGTPGRWRAVMRSADRDLTLGSREKNATTHLTSIAATLFVCANLYWQFRFPTRNRSRGHSDRFGKEN